MEKSLEQQAQEWVDLRDAERKSRREFEAEIGHANWPQTSLVNPYMLPEPLQGAVLRLLEETTAVRTPKGMLPPAEIEALREHFKESAIEMEKLLRAEKSD